MKFAPGRTLVPDLAETVVEDPDAKTITVKLHEGVMFTDGTELTAEVAKWNYDQGAASGKLQFADAIAEFKIVDKYNYVLELKYLAQPDASVPLLGAHVLHGRVHEVRSR